MDIKNLREAKNMTQEELAKLIGVDRTTITKIEGGARPSIDTAKKIGGALGFEWVKFYDEKKASKKAI